MKQSKPEDETPGVNYENHPARNLQPRAIGYGIGGGYEKPRRRKNESRETSAETYGPLPHSGYYGSGSGRERFQRGQAGFRDELSWYLAQYGHTTTRRKEQK